VSLLAFLSLSLIMKASKAESLRETWRRLQLPKCPHKILSLEEDEGGHPTENYVCERCGEVVCKKPK